MCLIHCLLLIGPDCKIYSLDNNGPCINGGRLACKGDEVVPHITCECPPNYQGKFCEEKMENVLSISISNLWHTSFNFYLKIIRYTRAL